jgi:hypothetical protein
LQWIATAVTRVFVVYADERDAAIAVCVALTDDQDNAVRHGVPGLLEILTDIVPVLHPADPGAHRLDSRTPAD